jgi:outer membrane protein
MKDIIKLFLLIIFLQFNQVYAAENIVYLNIEKLIHSSQAGKIIDENIIKNHKTNLDIFEKKENELKEEESKIISQKNILNEEEFKKKIDNLRKKVINYQNEKKQKIEELNILKSELTKKLLSHINPILAEYSDKNSISLIVDKKTIVLGKTELDITEKIINLLNEKVKEIKLN